MSFALFFLWVEYDKQYGKNNEKRNIAPYKTRLVSKKNCVKSCKKTENIDTNLYRGDYDHFFTFRGTIAKPGPDGNG